MLEGLLEAAEDLDESCGTVAGLKSRLRSEGVEGVALASCVGRLSKARNAVAHPQPGLIRRVLAVLGGEVSSGDGGGGGTRGELDVEQDAGPEAPEAHFAAGRPASEPPAGGFSARAAGF